MYPLLNQYLSNQNVSEYALSKCLGISQAALRKKLTGRLPFTFDEAVLLKENLQVPVSIEELFSKSDEYKEVSNPE